jgi:hypothetical protein
MTTDRRLAVGFFPGTKMTAWQGMHCGRLGGFKESVWPYVQVKPVRAALPFGKFKCRTIANSEKSTQIVVEIAAQVLIKN